MCLFLPLLSDVTSHPVLSSLWVNKLLLSLPFWAHTILNWKKFHVERFWGILGASWQVTSVAMQIRPEHNNTHNFFLACLSQICVDKTISPSPQSLGCTPRLWAILAHTGLLNICDSLLNRNKWFYSFLCGRFQWHLCWRKLKLFSAVMMVRDDPVKEERHPWFTWKKNLILKDVK